MKQHKLILDTNIFNRILDNKIQISDFPISSEFFVTFIQVDELDRTPDSTRRSDLKEIFQVVGPSYLPTETLILDQAHFGYVNIGEGSTYLHILEDLNRIERKNSNVGDALTSEVAIKNKLELVTMDESLKEVHLNHGGMLFDNFSK